MRFIGRAGIPYRGLRPLNQLPTNREIWTYCSVGERAYFVTRFLTQHG